MNSKNINSNFFLRILMLSVVFIAIAVCFNVVFAQPTASNPTPISVECLFDVPTPNVLVVTDEADPNVVPSVTWEDDISNGNTCPEIVSRRYRVTGDASQYIFVTQTITIYDNINPTAANPNTIYISNIASVPAPNPAVVSDETDNCSSPVVAFVSDVSDGGACPEIITRTYSVTDDCGNQILVAQTILVHDLTAPVFSTTPATITVSCSGNIPAMTNLNWTDNSDGTGSETGTDVSDGNFCPETITRTWTYTDYCGNVASTTQTITVHDLIAPVFAVAPANVTVSCAADAPAMTNLNWTDNCDGTGSVSGSDVSDGNSCPETITRTWTYTDYCGNVASVTQTITINDNVNPTATNPTTIYVPNSASVPAPNIQVVTDEADNCTSAPSISFVSDVSDQLSNPETITRTYCITDQCGNQTCVTQLIIIGLVGLNENDKSEAIEVYPNPTDGPITISLGASFESVNVTVRDVSGKINSETIYTNTDKVLLHIDEAPGFYLLGIRSDSQEEFFIRVLKE